MTKLHAEVLLVSSRVSYAPPAIYECKQNMPETS